jgi:hypothetical protein
VPVVDEDQVVGVVRVCPARRGNRHLGTAIGAATRAPLRYGTGWDWTTRHRERVGRGRLCLQDVAARCVL